MSVIKMLKMNLVGLTSYKGEILNALHKTASVELTVAEEIQDTFILPSEGEEGVNGGKYERAKEVVEFIEDRLDRAKKQDFYPENLVNEKVFVVGYDEFMDVPRKEQDTLKIIEKIEQNRGRSLEIKSELMKISNLIGQIKPYEGVDEAFNHFADTKLTSVFFGTVKLEGLDGLKGGLEELEFNEIQVLSKEQLAVICVVALKQEASSVEKKLSEFGFAPCPFKFDCTAKEKIAELNAKAQELAENELALIKEVCEYAVNLRQIKIYADYYKFLLQKAQADQGFRRTESTFLLTGYVPEPEREMVEKAVSEVTSAVHVEFSNPTEEDNPPTLLKNKNPVRQSEFVTDMYSAPNYREIDPNKIVFFFFMLFMGVIMADVGYGILMIVVGLTLSRRIKIDNGARRLWNVIALSGVSSIIFGLLFNSVLGFTLPYEAILPNPVPKDGSMDGLMTILLLCLALGVVHIATGYFCKALNSFKSGDVAGGIFEGLVWVLFFVGLVFATFNFLIDYLMPDTFATMNASVKEFFNTMAMPGIIIVVGAVVIAMLTAGRNERGFGKFTKGFGAVYGIINILSDVLSYARLFGLMLSGMIIATTFNDMGLSIIGGGGLGYLLGGLVMVVGHVFNIAMGVLGAYIHNSRLQYIEFFGKFYTGDGNKFKPLGSNLDYVYLTK